MLVPEDLKYRETHEWVQVQGDTARIGLSDHAQHELTDIVFVDLPEVGKKVKAGDAVCVVESTKIASDVYAPVSGTISAVNEEVQDDPSLVNSSPYVEGWLFEVKMTNPAEVDGLLSPAQYREKLD